MALQANGAVTPVADSCIICEFTGLASSEEDALDMLSGTEKVTFSADFATNIADGDVKSMTTV